MTSYRDQKQDARAYCEAIKLDPDEIVTGYCDTGAGVMEWVTAERWSFYVGANPDWDRPLTGMERAMFAQQEARDRAYAEAVAKQQAGKAVTSSEAKPQIPVAIAVMPGVGIQFRVPSGSLSSGSQPS